MLRCLTSSYLFLLRGIGALLGEDTTATIQKIFRKQGSDQKDLCSTDATHHRDLYS